MAGVYRRFMAIFSSRDSDLSVRHLRGIDDLSDHDIERILTRSLDYARMLKARERIAPILVGRTQINLFFEDSTRTNMSFELAGKKLGVDMINLPVAASSVNKNEELIDTVQTLAAMGADVMIVRAREPGIHQLLSEQVACSIINAGDGTHEHPTQGLLDAATIKSTGAAFKDVRIAICGDIRHSRVAGSGAKLLQRLGADVRFVAPDIFQPDSDFLPQIARYSSLQEGLEGCNFVMALRVQFERLGADTKAGEASGLDAKAFHRDFGLTHKSMEYAAPNAFIMHPGPMNRGIEIDGALADDRERSLVLSQVFHGVPTRMAILEHLLA